MVKAYPNSKFIGFDYHKLSIEVACKKAKEEGVSEDIITFEEDHLLIFQVIRKVKDMIW